MLVLQDISRVKNLNGLTNEKVPCNYACYALNERSSIFSVPKDVKVIGHFRYQGEKFALVGGAAFCGGLVGLGYFNSGFGVGLAGSIIGMLACKSEEIAKYVSTQFGKLVFDACFARHFKGEEFEWLD